MKKQTFYPKVVTEMVIQWIRNYFEKEENTGCVAVLGISGGKDSTVAAALCGEAIGYDRVVGVLMPNGIQDDLQEAEDIAAFLGIKTIKVNIKDPYSSILEQIGEKYNISEQTKINLSPRLRMSTLFAVAQSISGRVICTSNYSEYQTGYFTMFGDNCGHIAPLRNFTASEVVKIGKTLGLPDNWIEKPPADGLSGKTDEENLGFSYEVLDRYLRGDIFIQDNILTKIKEKIKQSEFKREGLKKFDIYNFTMEEMLNAHKFIHKPD
jgi:NAD+ synthase